MNAIVDPHSSVFKVVGVGGVGCRLVSMISGLQIPSPAAIEYIAMDTDAKALASADVAKRLQIGPRLLHGINTGSDLETGYTAALESRGAIRQSILGAEIVFIIAAVGGGTGAGTGSVVAEMARLAGVLTIGLVLMPFDFESLNRLETAGRGIDAFLSNVDAVFPIQQKFTGANEDIENTLKESAQALFEYIDMLAGAIYSPGIINIGIQDVKKALTGAGIARFCVGRAVGDDKGTQAAYDAFTNLNLSFSEKANGALFTIRGGSDLSLYEVNSCCDVIKREICQDADITFGVSCDASMGDEMKVALITTKYER